MSEKQLELFEVLTPAVARATLGILMPVDTAEERPPWAKPLFSHAFTGQVPVSVYEQWREIDEE